MVVRRTSNVATNDPADVIGSPASSLDRLMKSVLHRECWSKCARVGFSWDIVSGCQRSEIVRLREIAGSVGTCATVHTVRYLDLVEESFMVPSSILCDRLFLIAAADATYVESVECYPFERDIAYPGLGDRSLRDVVFRSDCVRPWKTSYSLMNGSHGCISYREFFTLRVKLAHAYDVMMAGRLQDRKLLMLPFSRFPPLPVEVVGALPPEGLYVHLPRVAFCFANCVQSAPESVRIRYKVSLLLEWAHSVAAALTLEIETNARVWKCSVECIDFFHLLSSHDDFFVESVNRFVVSVSFRSLVGKLRRVHEFTAAELTTRQDYPSGVTAAWTVIDPNDGSVVPPATSIRVTPPVSHRASRVAPPVVTSSSPPSHSSLDTVIPDAQIRTEPMWGPVFATEAIRISAWRVRDVIDQLVARIGVVEAKEREVAVEL